MKSKLVKIMTMILLVTMIVSTITTNAFAKEPPEEKEDAEDVENAGEYSTYMELIENSGGSDGGASTRIAKFIAGILNVAKLIGVGVAVIMLIVLAIKYISAAPGDKAEIKKHDTVYVVGAIVLFGASGILDIIRQFIEGNMY